MSQVGTTLCIPDLNCSVYILPKPLHTYINRQRKNDSKPGSTEKRKEMAGFELWTFQSQVNCLIHSGTAPLCSPIFLRVASCSGLCGKHMSSLASPD